MTSPARERVAAVIGCRLGLVGLGLLLLSGCQHDEPELVWGRKGTQPGDLVRPRAVAIDADDHLYIVDFTARIQAFDRDGHFLDLCWTTPDYRNGRPSGLSIDRDGNLLVSDSHYHCWRIYSRDGKELRVYGGKAGSGPGRPGPSAPAVRLASAPCTPANFRETQGNGTAESAA